MNLLAIGLEWKAMMDEEGKSENTSVIYTYRRHCSTKISLEVPKAGHNLSWTLVVKHEKL